MSFLLWHRIVIAEAGAGPGGLAAALGFGLPLRISNDVYTAGLVLDAEFKITMAEGAVAGQFEIVVYDLPERPREMLAAAAKRLTATISLGYFDNPALLTGNHPVMRGRVENVSTKVTDAGRTKTTVTGLEETGFALLNREAAAAPEKAKTFDDLTRALLESPEEPKVTLAPGSTLTTPQRRPAQRQSSVLAAIARLAEAAGAALVIRDGQVYLGPAVGAEVAPVAFDPETNLVRLGTGQELTADATASVLAVTVLGHPGLRAGQTVAVTGLPGLPAGTRRISSLVHSYNADGKNGYTCEVKLVDRAPGKPAPAPPAGTAADVIDKWSKAIIESRINNPAVDMGEVADYTAGVKGGDTAHRVTVHYAQAPAPKVASPSTDSPVDQTMDLADRPIATPFAFHNVGLMTPVYPGMRALLVHNRQLTADAVVAGWIWPHEPSATPPPNEAGDWWLALPTELDSQGRPTGKGVNDLIDARGVRTVQARALHIVVGRNALPTVGTRPSPAPADDTVTIEHASGTSIKIADDGALTITTSGKPITIGNGSVSVKLDGSTVAVS
jgi:hypothetical protein